MKLNHFFQSSVLVSSWDDRGSVVIHHYPWFIGKQETPLFVALGRNKKGEKYLLCRMHYSQKLASSDFSKAQIVVNDPELPVGFEISAVWGSFSFSNTSNGFISEQCRPRNVWLISILKKMTVNHFSWQKEKSGQGQRGQDSWSRLTLASSRFAETGMKYDTKFT